MIHSKLIGISGTLNSGKDFSAKIIQYLVARKLESVHSSVEVFDFVNFVNWEQDRRERLSNFKNRAFASTIKQTYLGSINEKYCLV